MTLFEKDLNFREYEDYDIVEDRIKEGVFQDVQTYLMQENSLARPPPS